MLESVRLFHSMVNAVHVCIRLANYCAPVSLAQEANIFMVTTMMTRIPTIHATVIEFPFQQEPLRQTVAVASSRLE